jgi:putative SOS response-associated peptidase YedK
MVPTDLPRGVVSPTHPTTSRCGRLLEAENVPVVSHIGGGGRPVRPGFHDNGHTVSDFLGGGENVRAKDFMAIHQRPEVFWAAMVLDGMFEQFPGLRGASVEEGAIWVPSWMRRLDRAMQFAKTEAPLRELTRLPSEYVRDHLRFTPFAGEPVGWMIEQAGTELFMFSSDYPHPEGTKNPIERFEATMDTSDADAMDRFHRANFEAKPAFKSLLAKKRCIVPMDGFYEWQPGSPDGPLNAKGQPLKQPMFIHRVDGEPLAVAGLWTAWKDPADADGRFLHSVTVITTAANPAVLPVHDRMPALLTADRWAAWLDPSNADVGALTEMLDGGPPELLTVQPVSTDVNNVRNNRRDLIEPISR